VFRTVLAGIVAVVAWLAWALLGEVIGEMFGYVLRPVTRPVWRAMVSARSPWPLIVMLVIGVSTTLIALPLLSYDDWRGGTGFLLFVGGAGLALSAPFLWRDARRQAASGAEHASRPVV